ncbi:MAG: hypothetical protein ACE5KE_15285, partial [Methanosarcinales archaeon]
MEILVISDIYGNIEILKELIIKLLGKKNDRIAIIAGDIGIYNLDKEEYLAKVERIFSLLLNISKYVCYVPGDSDLKDLSSKNPRVINLDIRYSILKNGNIKIGMLGLGGAPKH